MNDELLVRIAIGVICAAGGAAIGVVIQGGLLAESVQDARTEGYKAGLRAARENGLRRLARDVAEHELAESRGTRDTNHTMH